LNFGGSDCKWGKGVAIIK